MVRAKFQRQGLLFGRGHRANDARAQELGYLHQQQTHTARRRMHQHRVTRLNGICAVAEIMRSHTLQHQRARCLNTDIVRDRNDSPGRGKSILRIGADLH